MPVVIALAVSVGLLAVVATWLFGLDPLAANHLQVWQAFIAWAASTIPAASRAAR